MTRKLYESNSETVRIMTSEGEFIARIHPSENDDTSHKICYSSDDYFYMNDNDIISISPLSYKKSRTKKGVQYWNIGTALELKYIIETTKSDNDINIDYSNIHQQECNNMNKIMEIFNNWQKAGYKNISIQTVVTMENETIIEDNSVYMLELSVNSNEMSELKKENKNNEILYKQLELHRKFIKQFKAEKHFDKFVNDSLENNKDKNGFYWYEMRLRPVSIGCQPDGFVQSDESKGKYGIIAYDRLLSDNELKEYELNKWDIA